MEKLEEQLRYIGERIIEKKYDISFQITKAFDPEYVQEMESANIVVDAVTEWRTDLIKYLGEALIHNDVSVSMAKVGGWATQSGNSAVKLGVSFNGSLKTITMYRTLIYKIIEKELDIQKFSALTVLHAGYIIDPLLDYAVYCFTDEFVKQSNQRIRLAQEAIDELSVTVVPLAKGIGILPIIGSIDTYRAKMLMENSLQKCTELELTHLIFDLSGVAIIDTMVSQEIFKILNALRLLGVKTVLSGIRPEIAQTIVGLGIDFAGISITSTLHQALESIGLTIKPV